MRVLHVITDLRMGGAETALSGLARASVALGHRVEVVALKQLGMAAGPLMSEGIPCTALDAPDEPGMGLASTVLRLSAFLRKREVDVVHAWLASGCAAVHLAAPSQQARVYSIQVTDTPPRAICALLASHDGRRLVWVAASLAAAQSWTTALNGHVPQMRVIPNTVDVRGEPTAEPSGARPLFLGRLAHQKGVDVLLRALSGTDVTVDLRGAGPEENALRALAAELGVTRNVVFHGPTSTPLEALRSCSFLVLPSRAEGMPLVVMEAMACTRPVLATSVGGTDEVVIPDATGLLVPPEEPTALRAALLRLHGDATLRARLGAAGRERWQKHFRHDVVVQQFLAAYEDAQT